MAPQQLDPGATDHPTHGEAQQVDGGVGAEGRLDVAAELAGQLGDWRTAEPMGQVGDQQGCSPIAKGLLEAMEQPGAVPQPVHQHQRGVGRHRLRLGSFGAQHQKTAPWGAVGSSPLDSERRRNPANKVSWIRELKTWAEAQ